MTLYKIKFIELTDNEEDVTESYVTRSEYNALMRLYKGLKEQR